MVVDHQIKHVCIQYIYIYIYISTTIYTNIKNGGWSSNWCGLNWCDLTRKTTSFQCVWIMGLYPIYAYFFNADHDDEPVDQMGYLWLDCPTTDGVNMWIEWGFSTIVSYSSCKLPGALLNVQKEGDLWFAQLNHQQHPFCWLVVWNMNGLFVHSVGNVIIPSDELNSIMFQRGRSTQPPSSIPCGGQLHLLRSLEELRQQIEAQQRDGQRWFF